MNAMVVPGRTRHGSCFELVAFHYHYLEDVKGQKAQRQVVCCDGDNVMAVVKAVTPTRIIEISGTGRSTS